MKSQMATTITNIKQLDCNKAYSYADYLKWQFKERVELIKGRIFPMGKTPSSKHQEVFVNLAFCVGAFFKKKEPK